MALGRINRRIYPDGTGPRPDNSKHKREEAKERQEHYDSLSPEHKLTRLDTKLGIGLGATRERAKLQILIDAKKPKKEDK